MSPSQETFAFIFLIAFNRHAALVPPGGERGIAWAMCLLRHGLLDLNRGTFLLVWGRHGRMSRDSARWLEARDVLLLRAVLTRERPYDI